MSIVHVLPINDLKDHEESTTCECQPRVDMVENGMVVVHHAWDNREIVEQVETILEDSSMSGDAKFVRSALKEDGKTHNGWMVFCPACQCGHLFDNRWTFDGNMEKPTFSPSMLVKTVIQGNPDGVCHSFLTGGMWNFLNDCTHDKKGMQVPMEKF